MCVCAPVNPFIHLHHLEYVGEVSEVKDVVELDSGGQEGGGESLMEGQS